MEFNHFVNLIFIIAVNILFFFSGICLNSLVIVNFWRSVQLRKKLCYFMIMILSSCDLLVVLTHHPFTALVTMLWLTEKMRFSLAAHDNVFETCLARVHLFFVMHS